MDVAGHRHMRAQQRVPQAHQHLLRQDPGPAHNKEGVASLLMSALCRALFLNVGVYSLSYRRRLNSHKQQHSEQRDS